MITLAALLLAAAAAFTVARLLRVPVIPLLLIAGFAVSRWLDRDVVQDAAVLGAAFLLFAAGIELEPQRVKEQRRAAVVVGIVQFSALGGVALAVSLALGLDGTEAAYVGMAIAASSTLVVVRLLKTRQQMFEPFGRMVVGVLLLQDVLVILLIPLLTGLPEGASTAVARVAGTLGLFGLVAAASRWLSPLLFTRLGLDEEGKILTVLAVLFGFIGLAYLLELPVAAGAFLAGVSLARFPVSALVRGLLAPLSDFFLALFFTALGAVLILPSPRFMLIALALIAVVLLITPPLVALVADKCGLSARAAIEAGLLLAQTSELSLIVALQGVAAGHLSHDLLSTIVLVTLVTMVATPFIATNRATWALLHLYPSRRRERDVASVDASGHVLLLGCGSIGMPVVERLADSDERVVVVEDDPAVVERLERLGVEVVRGDGSDFALLGRVSAGKAKVVISYMRRMRDSAAVVRQLRDVPVLVHVFESRQGDEVRALGGIPIVSSEIAAERFLAWFEKHLSSPAQPAAEASELAP